MMSNNIWLRYLSGILLVIGLVYQMCVLTNSLNKWITKPTSVNYLTHLRNTENKTEPETKQNPVDCDNAQKVVYKVCGFCGYGCMVHHIALSLKIAYATNRTLILESAGPHCDKHNRRPWMEEAMAKYFRPLSDTCTHAGAKWRKTLGAPNAIKDVQVVVIASKTNKMPYTPEYIPYAIPSDLAPRLERLHGNINPSAWWIGQMLTYITRPSQYFSQNFMQRKIELGFKKPIIGVHVRRTDKIGQDSRFYAIEEYMVHVENYYDNLEKTNAIAKRRVYLATDDVNALHDAKTKYPNYEFISSNKAAQLAAVDTRYTDEALHFTIMDMQFLSQTDYIVGGFSSNIFRGAYEIMQTLHGDASRRYQSLDLVYFYGGFGILNQTAIISHQAHNAKELDMQIGDIVEINIQNRSDRLGYPTGYVKGKNLRTGKLGLLPTFKIITYTNVIKMPKYQEVGSD